ncbi:helix-turn-helix domain-containing protein [Celeribacter litoreus]|uniref:helix-turn-helix domain-containing protein n=1 Tax=Celeribacter litoreus TaxID=2876714 RepID=UPI001CCA8F7B|nr:helix-turn-helix transcriptional regulator [Celeribacter litoreus]MCA0043543.1 short-chain fatty acyl-CoA regulator family protein [Celeribacter litoreus]
MSRSALTGTRIRERRTLEGIKQADLARTVEISPAYLNLIEHNRRRIGGKLLIDIARALNIEPSALTEGAEAPLMEGLQDAASKMPQQKDAGGKVAPAPETARSEEFAGRFPGWAALVVEQRDRITALERRVEALNDRLAHDPFLSDSLHEVLSTVTAIRSTAGILNNAGEIDRDWQARFHRNLYEDSQRLAQGSQALVSYLDSVGKSEDTLSSPLEEVEAWLADRDFFLHELEQGQMPDIMDAPALRSASAKQLARRWVLRARAEAEKMPLSMVEAVVTEQGPDPAALAQTAGVDLPAAMRRLASMPAGGSFPPIGLAMCDGSGALIYRKPLDGFAPPRFGAACPLWPLYQALLRPMVPIRRVLEQHGQPPRRFLAYAIAQPLKPTSFEGPEIVEATMLFIPLDRIDLTPRENEVLGVGTSCRVCARTNCLARREPSLVLEEPEEG